jgi:predicted patatin/cPLA2 family phospholipase
MGVETQDTQASIEHPVIQEILRRRDGRTAGSAKLGLVVEGGAMRGVYSGGALVALDRLGLNSVFDEVYAESAGAINASYFLAGQTQMGIRIYTEDLQTVRFINPLRTSAIIDVNYIADVVLTRIKPLDAGAVLASRTNLFVAITNALDGSPRLVNVKRENLSLYALLKATAAIVPLYNRAVVLDGVPYVDGGISNPIPIQSALDAGCTHILVLLTRPPEFEMFPSSGIQKFILSLMLRGWNPEFVQRFYTERTRRYRLARDLAFGRTPCGAFVAVIGPGAGSPPLSRMTLSPRKLKLAMEDAMHRTDAAFAHHDTNPIT